MSDDTFAEHRARVGRLVYIAAGGKVSEDDIARPGIDLRDVGLDSLGYLNLLEGLERTFGLTIDLDEEEDHRFLHTIDNLVGYLSEREALTTSP